MDVYALVAIYAVVALVLLAQYVAAIIAYAVQNVAVSHVNAVQNA